MISKHERAAMTEELRLVWCPDLHDDITACAYVVREVWEIRLECENRC